ncbi:DUF6013 family protein [Paraburkholderia caffeinilytica]|uniref:DUF6013 family protein n=1 Tax=Paraburkholderia caffeinilytica TaxID=1761016 RepID=UPI003DA052BC
MACRYGDRSRRRRGPAFTRHEVLLIDAPSRSRLIVGKISARTFLLIMLALTSSISVIRAVTRAFTRINVKPAALNLRHGNKMSAMHKFVALSLSVMIFGIMSDHAISRESVTTANAQRGKAISYEVAITSKLFGNVHEIRKGSLETSGTSPASWKPDVLDVSVIPPGGPVYLPSGCSVTRLRRNNHAQLLGRAIIEFTSIEKEPGSARVIVRLDRWRPIVERTRGKCPREEHTGQIVNIATMPVDGRTISRELSDGDTLAVKINAQ